MILTEPLARPGPKAYAETQHLLVTSWSFNVGMSCRTPLTLKWTFGWARSSAWSVKKSKRGLEEAFRSNERTRDPLRWKR